MSSVSNRYFDNAATTQTDPRVVQAMQPYWGETFANPHSVHAMGRSAMAAVDHSLEILAELLGAEDPSQLVVTSGATEANNWVLWMFDQIEVGPFEHSSIRGPAAKRSAKILPSFPTETHPNTLTSWMWINNETGQMWDLPADLPGGGYFHSDLTQGAFKMPADISGLQYASLSAHKFHGPNGVGLLYAQDPTSLKEFIAGGEQQHGARSGTLAVPLIVGMAEAARITVDERDLFLDTVTACRDAVKSGLDGISDMKVNEFDLQAPQILSISFGGVEAQPLVMDLDSHDFSVGSGSACSAGSTSVSPVLKAMGMDESWARGTIRISFSRNSSKEESVNLSRQIRESVEKLRSFRIK